MKAFARAVTVAAFLAIGTASTAVYADDTSETVALFRKSDAAGSFFKSSYGYAVFPTVGEGGFIVAGGHGTGQVYVRGKYVGDTSMTQVSVGPQAGGQAYSQIIFFRDRAAFNRFTSGNYEFSADASAVAVTASADASAGTQGASSSLGTQKHTSGTNSAWRDGVAVFTIVKGGAMLQAAIGGQKFTYTPKGR